MTGSTVIPQVQPVLTQFSYTPGPREQMHIDTARLRRCLMLSQQMQENMTPIPEPVKAPDIDWSEKMQQLQSKSKADFALDAARKKGISNSTYTSPLLDDEEADTTHVSLVAGR